MARTAIGLIGVAACLSCSQPTESPAPTRLQYALGGCVTDLSCPYGQECVDGTCVPIQPSLYPHIQTASILMRAPFAGDEMEWCANHYDLMVAGAQPDEIRAFNPNARFFEYTLTRFHAFDQGSKTAFGWALTHGYDPEDFYLHYREDVFVPTWEGRVIVPGFPAGMVPGWNPGGGGNPASATYRFQSRVIGYYAGSPEPSYLANVAHPGFRQFFAERAAALIDGTWYFNTPFATGPIDGIMCDEAIYYPMFGEGLLDHSTEYYGIPMTENHPLAMALEELYPFLAEQLNGAIGSTVDVMPNYGHVLFLNYPNPAAVNIQATTPWILGEVWVSFTGSATPTSGANRCITYDKDYAQGVRKIVEQTRAGGRRLLGARDTAFGPSGTSQGKIFTLGLYYLVHNEHTYYVYESARHPSTSHASTWAWNPAAEFDVGLPTLIPNGTVDFQGQANTTEHWVFATGPDPYQPSLTYRVLARRFTNALVLVKMLPLGSVVDSRSTTTHPLDRNYRVLQADGSLGVTVSEARLRNNEALILIPDAMTGVD